MFLASWAASAVGQGVAIAGDAVTSASSLAAQGLSAASAAVSGSFGTAPTADDRCLLSYPDSIFQSRSTDVAFERCAKVRDAPTLEFLREAGRLRRLCCGGGPSTSDLVQQTTWCEEYLQMLETLSNQSSDILGQQWLEQLPNLEWASALAARPGQYYNVKSTEHNVLLAEKGMVLCNYAGLLGDAAGVAASSATAPGAASNADAAKSITAAATLLRRAAGVYIYVHAVLLPKLEGQLAVDRPAVLRAPVLAALALVALGEAQASIAARGAATGASPGVQAKLHAGAAGLFEEAARGLKVHTGRFALAERFHKLLALSTALHSARALVAQAAALAQEGRPGQAVADVLEALRRLDEAGPLAAEDPAWQAVVARARAAAAAAQGPLDREREVVYVQPVAASPSPLPQGHTLAVAIEYRPPAPAPGPL